MISLTLTLSLSPSIKPSFLPSFKPLHTGYSYNQVKPLKQRRKPRDGKCSAEFSTETPVAIAIGACILNSLIFPTTSSREDMEAESLIDSSDARFAVMGVISFIPFFNWMSWVFAWMDTGNRRYAVYAIIYLAPYLRSNPSISPEESWLPLASILLCIAHIQIEANMKDVDIHGFQVFNEAAKRLLSLKENEESVAEKDYHNLPSVDEKYTNKIHEWPATDKPQQDPEILSEDDESNGGSNMDMMVGGEEDKSEGKIILINKEPPGKSFNPHLFNKRSTQSSSSPPKRKKKKKRKN